MKSYRQLSWYKRLLVFSTMGTTFAWPLGACDLGEFQTTSTVTLDGREVVAFLIRSTVLSPIEQAVDRGVDWLFDRLDPDEEE